ncbi:MAG: hypothetical protein K1X74_22800 [Pirellulales bacterium]|nr:hypothetical protein [Pirellulales bacterium]
MRRDVGRHPTAGVSSVPALRRRIAVGVLVACGLALVSPATAAEPFRAFLDELQRRGMYDVALDYLHSARTNPLISDELKQTITYEEGVTLIEGASQERDIPKRMKSLELAKEKLNQFVQEQPGHPLAGSARIQLGNILVSRAQADLELSRVPSQAAKKDSLVQEARKLFAEAEKVSGEAVDLFESQLKGFPKFIDPKERKQIEAKDQARLDLIQAMLLSALATFEHGHAYDAAAAEYKSLIDKAATKFENIYDRYKKLLAGLYARMYQARCLQDLGDPKKALTLYGELLIQPDDPQEFRELKTKSLGLAMECWNSDAVKQYEESVTKGQAWLQSARGNEDRTPDGLKVRWRLSQALVLRAAGQKDGTQRDHDLRAALEQAAAVAKSSGEFQQSAREFVAKARNTTSEAAPTSFAEAVEKGRIALDTLQVALGQLKAAPAEQAAELNKQADSARADAARLFQLALSLRTADTPIEDVNQVRYYQCFVNYQAGRYYDAAVLGEFLARRYSNSSYARKAAQIALASYLAAFNAEQVADRQFEQAQMVSIAQFLGATWPNESEADEAWMILADLAIRAGDLDTAVKHLENISAESPRRAEADLKLGQSLWNSYLKKSRLPAEEQPQADEQQAMVARAQATLEAGVKRMREAAAGSASFTLLSAELSLAQIYVGSGQVEQALRLLEMPNAGILALIAAKDPSTSRGNFAVEAYKVALRAYVSAQQLDKAEQMMNALESATGTSDSAMLTKIYLGLGMELEDQVARLRAEKNTAELAKVLKGFELFLDRIAARKEGNTFNSLMWVADTFARLGEGLVVDNQVSPEAQAYFGKATQTYEQILARLTQDPGFGPTPESANSVNVRMAKCERRLGRHEAAVKRLVEVLMKKPSALEAQIEAAYTYEDWGRLDTKYFLAAIGGAQRVRRGAEQMNLVWGWSKLAQTVQKHAQYKDIYYEARFNVADCYYRLGMVSQGQPRTDALAKAESAINVMARLEKSDFGGPDWFARFDRLLRQVQRANGGKGEGLKALIDSLSSPVAKNEPPAP